MIATPMLEEVERLLGGCLARKEKPAHIVIGNRQAAVLEAELRAAYQAGQLDVDGVVIGTLVAHSVDVSWALEMWGEKPLEINLVTMTGPATLYEVPVLRVDEDDCFQVAVAALD